ncbi:5-formyltetrahydrofolate cyclo-ligase [uncultured Bifidobacterium sp.]|uniref:5-formyltetrahydrofolate cyclo-ligase n=1 Tax=Bifidobacterium ruminantium TaxID=78346 RepID=UPI0035A60326
MDMHGRTIETEDAEAQRALKQQWRKDALAKRKKTTIAQRQEAGRLLAIRARETALVRPGSTVAAFVSMGSEIPMTPLLETLFDMDCRVLVPRLGAGMEIGWSELDGIDGLRDQHNADGSVNTHRPQEPDNAADGPEALAEAELVIVPAFAVDEHGFRLGRGGGWYDRALLRRSATARVIAVCWPWETTDTTVPHEPHDIPVDGTLTPDGYHAVRG